MKAALIIVLWGVLLLPASSSALSWSEETFAAARAQQKPILLIVSVASCHECAAVAPDPDFILVELNADEHPRIAAAYARFARAAGNAGAYPIQLALTPFLDPLAVIDSAADRRSVATRWRDDRDAMIAESGLVMRRLQLSGAASAAVDPPDTPLQRARSARALLRSPDGEDRQKAFAVLRGMTATPLYDLLGGGFHHAARDAAWTIPRFEKLLRDQAEIAIAFTEAWQSSPEPLFEEVARLTLDQIAHDFFDVSRRAFATGLAADALVPRRGPEVLEGGHYVWRLDEIQHLLGPSLSGRVASHFGLTTEGNVPRQFDPRGDFEGRNVFMTRTSDDPEIQKAVEVLRATRSNRPLHLRDPRVITEYNALAISALARGAAVFGERSWIEAAARAAAQFLGSKRIVRSARVAPTAPDCDALVHALIDMYEVTFDPAYLERALAVQREAGSVEPDAEVPEVMRGFLPAPRPVVHPGPSGAERVASITAPGTSPIRQLVIAGPLSDPQTDAFLRSGRQSFLPPRMVIVIQSRRSRAALERLMPYLAGVTQVEEKVAATVCQQGRCRTPATDPATVDAWLNGPAAAPAP
jgi:uncharacterized protein YyaL (SSP411 family)